MGLDLLVRNGVLVTMDPARRVLHADLRVRDGVIFAIGKEALKDDGRICRVLDARGCAVLPGLVQAHVHLCQVLFRNMADDLPLLEWLKQRIWPLEAAHDAASLGASARLGIAELLKGGTTTLLDMGTVHHHDAVFEAMQEAGIRGASGKTMMDVGDDVPAGLRETTASSLAESERLFRRWHGAAEGRLRYALAPRFILSCSEDLLRGVAERSRAWGALMHTHAAEHAEERAVVKRALGVDDVAALRAVGVCGPRAVIAHGVQLRPDEMREIAADGTRFVHCPSANLKLASGIADVRAMQEAGIVVGLGADGAPCNNRLDAFTELREAALLAKVKRGDASAMPAMDALALATIEGAKVLGLEHEVGSIEVGKRADLAVVRLDRLHQEPGEDVVSRVVYAATASDVRDVLVDGVELVRDGELCTLDEERVLATARTQAKRLLARARL